MTELRKRMIEDMQLAGLSQSTQEAYVRSIRQLTKHYRLSPDRITERQLRDYLIHLRDVRRFRPDVRLRPEDRRNRRTARFRRRFQADAPAGDRQTQQATRCCPWPSRYWSCCARSGRSIAITNTRIVALDDTHVTFKYKQRETGQWEVCRLTGLEFFRRFLMHVLPKGFHKLRHYGLWHPSKRDLQQRARLMLALLGRLLPAGRPAG